MKRQKRLTSTQRTAEVYQGEGTEIFPVREINSETPEELMKRKGYFGDIDLDDNRSGHEMVHFSYGSSRERQKLEMEKIENYTPDEVQEVVETYLLIYPENERKVAEGSITLAKIVMDELVRIALPEGRINVDF
jgi:hypothetical protein